jgi:hypothetical protein
MIILIWDRRLLLVAVAFVGLAAAICIWNHRTGTESEQRQHFIHELRSRGGSVEIDSGLQYVDGPSATSLRDKIETSLEHHRLVGRLNQVTLPPDAGLDDAVRMNLLRDTLSLVVRSDRFGDDAVQGLPELINLRSIEIQSNSVTARGLSRLPEWRSLRQITLRGNLIVDSTATHLLRCGSCPRIDVSGTRIGNEGARRLLTHANAESLVLDNLGLSENCIIGLKPSDVNTQSLSIAGNLFEDRATAFFYRVSSIKVLDISSSVNGPDSALAIGENSTLDWLTADGIRGNVSEFLKSLAPHKTLYKLSIRNVALNRADLKNLLHMPRLAQVDLRGCGVTEAVEIGVREELDAEDYFDHLQITVIR